jgi:mannose-1-phosphate guanylyltransferase
LLAGGRGTRFWPASREALPKQFLAVGGKETLLGRTGLRLAAIGAPADAWVVTNAAHVELARRQLPDYPAARILGEPVGRNTAPCIALAAALVAREDPDGVLIVAPADHWIPDEAAFAQAMKAGVEIARTTSGLVTFGVVPTSPATGYGYIEAEDRDPGMPGGARRVARFTEKPERAVAERFLASGRHLWNSGIFAWRAGVFLAQLEKFQPQIADGVRKIADAQDARLALAVTYPSLPSISVDYAVLERAPEVWVVPARFPWSDVGSWDSLAELLPRDEKGNTLRGDVLAEDARGCFVDSEGRLVVLLGTRDLLVISRPDALLISAKGRSQDVKAVVDALERTRRNELL